MLGYQRPLSSWSAFEKKVVLNTVIFLRRSDTSALDIVVTAVIDSFFVRIFIF